MKGLEDFRWTGGHLPKYRSRNLGSSPVSGRPLYGWSVECQCGWECKSNEAKRFAEQEWKRHTREALIASKGDTK